MATTLKSDCTANRTAKLSQIDTGEQFARTLTRTRLLAASGVVLGLLATGCGASSNSAPVVYGTEPAQGRIYNSPAEIYLDRPAQAGAPVNSGTIADTRTALVRTNPGVDPYANPQGVRIYNRPPSPSTVSQSSLSPAPYETTQPVQAVYGAPYEPVILTPVGSTVATQQQSAPVAAPAYRGLPPAPVYLTGERANNTASSPYRAATEQPSSYGAVDNGAAESFITVEPGDTVFAIARKTGFQPRDIIAANNLYAPYNLTIGQVLRLPVPVSVNAAPSNGYADPYAVPSTVTTPFDPAPTPASQPTFREVSARDVLYTVQAGDTLYSIARRHNIGVQAITNANRLNSPFTLGVGQQLLLPAVPVTGVSAAPRQQLAAAPTYRAAPVTKPAPQPRVAAPAQQNATSIEGLTRQASYPKPQTGTIANSFDWPVKGAILSTFGTGGVGRRNDGINIAATFGAPVRAAADGEVVYRGSELDGYGNLLLIKHDGGFVTAYAHNDAMVVRKGQKVSKGQIIAKVGKTGAVNEPQLHFEIRQNLKSLDPMQFLAPN